MFQELLKILRFPHFWSYAHMGCIFCTSFLCNSCNFQCFILGWPTLVPGPSNHTVKGRETQPSLVINLCPRKHACGLETGLYFVPLEHDRHSHAGALLQTLNDVRSLVAIDTVDGLALHHVRVPSQRAVQGELRQLLGTQPTGRVVEP